MAGGAQRGRPQPARLGHLGPGGPVDPQAELGPAVVGIERAPGELRRPHPALGPVAGAAVAPLEGLGGRAQRRRQVQVGSAAHRVGGDDLGSLALDQHVDVGQVVDVHRLAEVGVPIAPAALQDHDRLWVHPGDPVELGQPPGGDRAAEPRAHDDHVDVLAHGRYPLRVRSRLSRRR